MLCSPLPSVIRFTTTVTNTGNYDAKNITVSSSGVSLASIALLAPGESFTTMRDVQVNMVGKFRFDATLSNELGEATTFEGNIIQVQQAAPTSAPTQVPVTTPQPFVAEELPTEDTLPAAVTTFQGVLTTLYYIFAVLAVISAVLLAASIAGRVMNRPKDGQEQLQLSERRNYTEEVPEDERVMIADESENASEAEEKPETAETADAVQTADDVAANEKARKRRGAAGLYRGRYGGRRRCHGGRESANLRPQQARTPVIRIFAPVSEKTADRGFVSLCDDFVTFFAKSMFFLLFARNMV